MLEIELMAAERGDALWIRYGRAGAAPHHVLIDTGPGSTAGQIKRRFRDDPELRLDLLVLTHLDADHIGGSIQLLEGRGALSAERVDDVWFNGWRQIDPAPTGSTGLVAASVSALIEKRKLDHNRAFGGAAAVVPDTGELPAVTLDGGMKLTLLSPTLARLEALRKHWLEGSKHALDPGDERAALALLDAERAPVPGVLDGAPTLDDLVARAFIEDDAPANGSSIALLAEYAGHRLLLSGDAFPSVLSSALARLGPAALDLSVLKVSHHGSRHNTSPQLAASVRCDYALISSSGSRFAHPDAECIARLIDANTGDPSHEFTLGFNYASSAARPWTDSAFTRRHRYTTLVGDSGALRLALE
jgi:hypothetical protein